MARGFRDPQQLIRIIIGVNIGMYIIAVLFDPLASNLSLNPLAFLAPATQSLFLLGATGTVPIDAFQRWWTLVSANYLHGGILHLAFNMMALRQLGPLVAQEYGASRLMTIYTLAGIGGFGVSYVAGIRFTIGASAALFGLIGAALYYGKSRGGTYGQAVYRQVGGWAVFIFIFGLIVPGINNWGHGGGLVAGVLLGFLLGYQEQRRENLVHTILANVCIVCTLAILLWAVLSGFYTRVLG